MKLLDRHILARFFLNFVLLFALLFVFASAIDIVLNLDAFVEAAHRVMEGDAAEAAVGTEGSTEGGGSTTAGGGGLLRFWATLAGVMFNFEGPRIFHFFSFLHGLAAVGAMGFTLAQMYRHRELAAMLATGISLHRVGVPFVLGMFALSLAQLANQEFMLPRVAPLLLRGHGDIGRTTIQDFPVTLLPDGAGRVFHSPAFHPQTQTMDWLTVLERDARGRLTGRVSADRATWSEPRQAWLLEGGRAISVQSADLGSVEGGDIQTEPGAAAAVEMLGTDLSPQVLTLRHYEQFSTMLSLRQIRAMLDSPGITNVRTLLRQRFSRFSMVLVNLLVMVVALPSFLIREPANLLKRSVTCSGIAIVSLLGAGIFMLMDLPIAPAVGVFLPVIVLFPLALGRAVLLKT